MPAASRRQFDYEVPESFEASIGVGARVRISFHGRRVGGWVSALGATPPPGVEVRPVAKLCGHGPPPAVLELAQWAAWRWAMPVATILRSASPDRNVWTLPDPPRRLPARRVGAARAREVDRERGGDRAGVGVTLRRIAPAHDLLPVVLEAAEAAAGPLLVLVPSTGWATRLAERLRRRGLDVASDWAEAAAGWPVVVGSRAAAWSPLPSLGAAVVLDAHDYHDRYDAAAVVAERAARAGAPCVLATPCPTAVQVARYGPTRVPERSVERAGWAAVVVVDRRGGDPRTGLFSEELARLARRVLPDRLVCVLHRTGRARLLACAACGDLARCEACGRTVELVGDALRCRSCGTERPARCASCGGGRLKILRPGVSRVREELAALLGVPVGEVSATTAEVPETPVLVGTEAVLHRVRRAAAVCFLDFDQHLLAPRLSAGEDSLALLARATRLVGGRAGADGLAAARGTGPAGERPADRAPGGTVLVQTRLPDHDVLRAAVAGDPGLATEMDVRAALRLPPFSALATVRAPSAPALDGVEVSSLADGRWLVRAPDHGALCDAVAQLHGGVRIDPDDV